MSTLMLVNPRKRRGPRTAAQKAATRRMIAANRGKRQSNPSRRKYSVAKRRHNPIHSMHRIHRRKRNPSMRAGMSGITGMLMQSLKGAGGAVAVNVVCGFLPASLVPVSVAGTVNYQLYAVRAALAVALGAAGKKVMGNSARDMALGALTVNFHDFINAVAGTALPGGNLHGMGETMIGQQQNVRHALPGSGGQVFDTELAGMGEYMYR